jgi:hypothetical protein
LAAQNEGAVQNLKFMLRANSKSAFARASLVSERSYVFGMLEVVAHTSKHLEKRINCLKASATSESANSIVEFAKLIKTFCDIKDL